MTLKTPTGPLLLFIAIISNLSVINTGNAADLGFLASTIQKDDDIQVARGMGKHNGVSYPILSLTGFKNAEDLENHLRNELLGSYTVSRQSAMRSQVILVAKAKSNQCPTCKSPSKDNANDFLANLYTISIIDLPDVRLAFASGGEHWMAAIQAKAVYSGPHLTKTKSNLLTISESEFVFGDSFSYQFEGVLKLSLHESITSVAQDISDQGYKPMAPPISDRDSDNKSFQDKKLETWIKDSSVLNIQYEKLPGTNTTRIGIYEAITKKS